MLRKVLEILGFVESRKVVVYYVGPRTCETLDSLAVIEALNPSMFVQSRKGRRG